MRGTSGSRHREAGGHADMGRTGGIGGFPQLLDGGSVTGPATRFMASTATGRWKITASHLMWLSRICQGCGGWHDRQLETSVQLVLDELKAILYGDSHSAYRITTRTRAGKSIAGRLSLWCPTFSQKVRKGWAPDTHCRMRVCNGTAELSPRGFPSGQLLRCTN